MHKILIFILISIINASLVSKCSDFRYGQPTFDVLGNTAPTITYGNLYREYRVVKNDITILGTGRKNTDLLIEKAIRDWKEKKKIHYASKKDRTSWTLLVSINNDIGKNPTVIEKIPTKDNSYSFLGSIIMGANPEQFFFNIKECRQRGKEHNHIAHTFKGEFPLLVPIETKDLHMQEWSKDDFLSAEDNQKNTYFFMVTEDLAQAMHNVQTKRKILPSLNHQQVPIAEPAEQLTPAIKTMQTTNSTQTITPTERESTEPIQNQDTKKHPQPKKSYFMQAIGTVTIAGLIIAALCYRYDYLSENLINKLHAFLNK